MSVTAIHEWRMPGCTADCWPRSHDPISHENYGRLLERETLRIRVVKTGDLVVDLDRRTVYQSGTEVALSEREWQLMAYYAERPHHWCLASEIIVAIWGGVAADSALSTARWRLRAKLGSDGPLIEMKGAKNGLQWSRLRVEGMV